MAWKIEEITKNRVVWHGNNESALRHKNKAGYRAADIAVMNGFPEHAELLGGSSLERAVKSENELQMLLLEHICVTFSLLEWHQCCF